MAYKVELPPDLDNSLGGLSLPKNTGDRGDHGDRDHGLIEHIGLAPTLLFASFPPQEWSVHD